MSPIRILIVGFPQTNYPQGQWCPVMERQMTQIAALNAIAAQKDGPIKKFQLIKTFGAVLPDLMKARTMSCAELEAAIRAVVSK